MRINIREIVKDILSIFKKGENGIFYLPQTNDFYLIYNEEITIILVIEQDKNIENFIVDGNFYQHDDIININITYNPKNKTKMLYDLIGELNEVLAHELRHLFQVINNTHDLNSDESSSFSYYSQPHEIDAQISGFKRIAKLQKKPFKDVVINWFKTHKDIHKLTNSEVNKIVNILISKSGNN